MSVLNEYSCARTRKGRGRPKGQLGPVANAIRHAVLADLVPRYPRMTVRQVFYALEVAGIVEKNDGGYRQVQAQVLKMRREGLLPWSFITDGTRWQRKPDSWDSAEDYIEVMARSYRRDLWRGQRLRIEVWLEKDALADIVVDVTTRWDVALMVSRGQSSSTFLYTAAQAAEDAYRRDGTTTAIYALYDFDAGGERAARTIERDLPEYAPLCAAVGDAISFERLAVTPDQIVAWDLPRRPAKKTDPEADKHGSIAVELDAIPPEKLTALVEDAITSNIDPHAWEIEQDVEEQERAGLVSLLNGRTS